MRSPSCRAVAVFLHFSEVQVEARISGTSSSGPATPPGVSSLMCQLVCVQFHGRQTRLCFLRICAGVCAAGPSHRGRVQPGGGAHSRQSAQRAQRQWQWWQGEGELSAFQVHTLWQATTGSLAVGRVNALLLWKGTDVLIDSMGIVESLCCNPNMPSALSCYP